jgi:hypothetical protein
MTMENKNSKFVYREKVKVINGFYRGYTGIVLDVHELSFNRFKTSYYIKLGNGLQRFMGLMTAYIDEDCLEKY